MANLEYEVLREYYPDTGLILVSDFKQGQFIQGYVGEISYIVVLWDVYGIPKAYLLN